MSFADSFNQPTIGTNFAIGETRFRLPLHLLRFTVRSSAGTAQKRARARAHSRSEAGCTRSCLHAGQGIARLCRRTSDDTRKTRGCGAEEIRTPDLLLAKETLYQLSHGPEGPRRLRTDPKGAASIAAVCVFLEWENRGGRFWTRTRDLCLIRAVL